MTQQCLTEVLKQTTYYFLSNKAIEHIVEHQKKRMKQFCLSLIDKTSTAFIAAAKFCSLQIVSMTLREAQAGDIDQMMIVRLSVNENRLSNPALITKEDYEEYLFRRGKGWVFETGNTIVGFSIADLEEHNIWALFITPGYEKKGIGRRLHDMMMNWYFSKTRHTIWLSTAPGSRAERFYRQAGWKEVGHTTQGEIKFEMSYEDHRNSTVRQLL